MGMMLISIVAAQFRLCGTKSRFAIGSGSVPAELGEPKVPRPTNAALRPTNGVPHLVNAAPHLVNGGAR